MSDETAFERFRSQANEGNTQDYSWMDAAIADTWANPKERSAPNPTPEQARTPVSQEANPSVAADFEISSIPESRRTITTPDQSNPGRTETSRYLPDGSLESSEVQDGDRIVEQTTYHDGRPQEHTIYDQNGGVSQRTNFRPDGTVAERAESRADGLATTSYNADGTRIETEIQRNDGSTEISRGPEGADGFSDITRVSPDGTQVRELIQPGSSQTVRINPDGTGFNNIQEPDGSSSRTTYLPDGTQIRETTEPGGSQRREHISNGSVRTEYIDPSDPTGERISRVTVHNVSENGTSSLQLERSFDNQGRVREEITLNTSGPGYRVSTFNPNGSRSTRISQQFR